MHSHKYGSLVLDDSTEPLTKSLLLFCFNLSTLWLTSLIAPYNHAIIWDHVRVYKISSGDTNLFLSIFSSILLFFSTVIKAPLPDLNKSWAI